MDQTLGKNILAIDFGNKRVGLALANVEVKLAHPYKTIENTPNLINDLKQIIEQEGVSQLVIGYPRGLEGQHTEQTVLVEEFVNELRSQINFVPIDLQDEALTSTKAEAELNSRNKPYDKGDVDALAATYILEDWLYDSNSTPKEGLFL
jgi:putative Holliday junction resolvase